MKRLTRIARNTLKAPKLPFPGWQKNLAFVFVLCMLGLVGVDYLCRPRAQAPITTGPAPVKVRRLTPEEHLRLATDRVLSDFGIRLSWIQEKGTTRVVRVPREIDPLVLYQSLTEAVRRLDGKIVRGRESLRTGEMQLAYTLSERDLATIRLIPDAKLSRFLGRLAIVIDDFGYSNDEVIDEFVNLDFPISYSIIPGLQHSTAIAQRLQQKGREVMAHVPMEALERQVERNGYELMVGMTATELRARVRKTMAALPQAQGMNNHMGSRATQDDDLLTAVCAELKPSGWFFLDSRTVQTTRAFALARKSGVAAGLNDTFLDNVEDPEHVRQKLWYLADLAATRGQAIAIGHPHRVTLNMLKQLVPHLQQRGFEIVTAGTLIRGHAKSVPVLAQQPIVRRN